ncbi:MAG: holo-[acyl-carrier-protein] synthase [Planctomycetota bacterium]|nr:MAG: holo-[acyl-carrier-protein] synthase [Planctomycetota bacterium]
MIVGLGTDIIEIARIAAMVDRHGRLFLERVYTPSEREHCLRRKHANEALAGRWAAKEAVMKVLGTGFIRGIGWQDIEIVAQRSGRPVVRLHRGAARRARQLGITDVLVSISHCRSYAMATAIGLGNAPPPPEVQPERDA